MKEIEYLARLNPQLELFDVYSAEFSPYGRVLGGITAQLSAALEAVEIPDEGNSYVASLDALEKTDAVKALCGVFGGMDIQAGCCCGRGRRLNALEYHKCSEVNCSTTGLVLLLALPGELKDGCIHSSRVRGFYLPPDTMIEIYPRVLHFAPCSVTDDGFNCLVVLERGVNSPLDAAEPGSGDKLLWMRGKWLTCHPNSPQAKKGAFCGISGDNIELKIKEADK